MIPSNNISRVYDPHTLSIMAIAFDRACDFLPVQFRDSDYMRRKLASHIIRHVNDGESDPTRKREVNRGIFGAVVAAARLQASASVIICFGPEEVGLVLGAGTALRPVCGPHCWASSGSLPGP